MSTMGLLRVVPRDVADRLELHPTRPCPIETAGGGGEISPLAEVKIRLDGTELTTPSLIAARGSALLGAVALESVLLTADAVTRRLIPAKGFVGELISSVTA
jgi:predicted aspartyl protease